VSVRTSRRGASAPKAALFVALLALALVASLATSGRASGADKSVKIVITGPLSGAGAFASAIALGAKARFDYQNDVFGGINGYRFDVTVLDNQISATGGALTTKQALAQNPFVMIIGGSAPFGGAAGVLREDAPTLPVWGIANAAVIAASHLKNAYGLQANYTRECYLFAKYAKETLKANNIAIAWQTDAVGSDTGKNCPNYAKRIGVGTVTSIAVPFNTTDFGPFASQLQNSGAKAVVVVMSQPQAAGLQKAAAALGFKGQWMGFNGLDGAYVKVAGSLAEGLLASNALLPLTSTDPPMALFNREVTKRVGADKLTGNGEGGWTEASIIIRGVKDATTGGKTLTQANFLKAINKLHGQQIGVAAGVSYNGADHTTIASKVTIFKVKNGQFVPFVKNVPLPTH
jgi:ABC-type branched-subunit amino acid transport system substrate-binding protein